jgi:hypothetical protein
MINRLSIIAVVSFALAGRSFAAIPFTVGETYNSGVNPYTNAQLAGGSADLLFNLYSFTPAPFSGAATVVPTADNGPGWVTASPAQWIAPMENETGVAGSGNPAGSYTYQGSFASDFLVPTTITVTGAFAADNSAQLYINGVLADSTPAIGFTALTQINFTFTASAGLAIVPVQFVVDNTPDANAVNPTGLLVSDLVFSTTATTPEPSTWLLLIGGAGALLVVQRRRFASLL